MLRPVGKILSAESPFGVQFKAFSVKDVSYDANTINWFKALEIPVFFSRVDSGNGLISFYSTVRWNQLHPGYNYKDICFDFDIEDVSVTKGRALVGLHPPILNCTELESRTDDFARTAYKLFKKWIEFETESIKLRKFNIFRSAKWKTGQGPTIYYTGSNTTMEERMEDLSKAKPIIEKLSFHALDVVDPAPDLLKAFLRIYKWYQNEGFTEDDFDNSELLRSQMAEWKRQKGEGH